MSIPKEPPSALTYAWIFSQPPATIIARLRENAELWDVLCEEIGGDVLEGCASIVDAHATDCANHEGYCYASELRDIAAKIRARGGE